MNFGGHYQKCGGEKDPPKLERTPLSRGGEEIGAGPLFFRPMRRADQGLWDFFYPKSPGKAALLHSGGVEKNGVYPKPKLRGRHVSKPGGWALFPALNNWGGPDGFPGKEGVFEAAHRKTGLTSLNKSRLNPGRGGEKAGFALRFWGGKNGFYGAPTACPKGVPGHPPHSAANKWALGTGHTGCLGRRRRGTRGDGQTRDFEGGTISATHLPWRGHPTAECQKKFSKTFHGPHLEGVVEVYRGGTGHFYF